MDRVKLQVSVREGRGSKDAKALRAAGEIPGVIYSATTDTQAITVNARALRQAVSGGLHTILDVTLEGDGKGRPVLIKDLQLDPVRGRVVHIDTDPEGSGAKPADLLPISLAACTAWDVVNILQKQRQDLQGMDVRIETDQDEDPPWAFTRILMQMPADKAPLCGRAARLE